jgi:hypothetical protein
MIQREELFANAPSSRQIICRFCKCSGHKANPQYCKPLADKITRDNEKEQRRAQMSCYYCKGLGHKKHECPVLKTKEEKCNKDFPKLVEHDGSIKNTPSGKNPWSQIVRTNRSEKIVKDLDLQNKAIEQQELERKQQELAKKHAEYLERCAKRERIAQEHAQRMEQKYGTRWFDFVEEYRDGIYDCAIAQNLRYEYQQEMDRREYEQDERGRKEMEQWEEKQRLKDEEEEMRKKTMLPKDFKKWFYNREQEEIEKEMDDYDCAWVEDDNRRRQYEKHAPAEYANYSFMTSICYDYEAKVLENRRLMNEWLEEKKQGITYIK